MTPEEAQELKIGDRIKLLGYGSGTVRKTSGAGFQAHFDNDVEYAFRWRDVSIQNMSIELEGEED